jgi:hypothetical protein
MLSLIQPWADFGNGWVFVCFTLQQGVEGELICIVFDTWGTIQQGEEGQLQHYFTSQFKNVAFAGLRHLLVTFALFITHPLESFASAYQKHRLLCLANQCRTDRAQSSELSP